MSNFVNTLKTVTAGEEQSFRNLSVTPLILPDFIFELDYITLEEAIQLGDVTITETSSQGTVPELLFINTGNQAVLLLDGEELSGAKQDRIVNLTILAPASSKLKIPVSCVEAGRWRHDSAAFSVADRAMFSRARARKTEDISFSLRNGGTRNSKQGEVWEDISHKADHMASHSNTEAMSSIFEKHRSDINAYVSAFTATENQAGAVFHINGIIAGIELFDHSETLKKLLPKLVRSYALDSLDSEYRLTNHSQANQSVEELLNQISRTEVHHFPAVGEGTDIRLNDPCFSGGALEARNRVIHLCAFPKEDNSSQNDSSESSLARASFRRRRYH